MFETLDIVTSLDSLCKGGVQTICLDYSHLPGESCWLITLYTLHTIDHILKILVASNALNFTVLQFSNSLEHHRQLSPVFVLRLCLHPCDLFSGCLIGAIQEVTRRLALHV